MSLYMCVENMISVRNEFLKFPIIVYDNEEQAKEFCDNYSISFSSSNLKITSWASYTKFEVGQEIKDTCDYLDYKSDEFKKFEKNYMHRLISMPEEDRLLNAKYEIQKLVPKQGGLAFIKWADKQSSISIRDIRLYVEDLFSTLVVIPLVEGSTKKSKLIFLYNHASNKLYVFKINAITEGRLRNETLEYFFKDMKYQIHFLDQTFIY